MNTRAVWRQRVLRVAVALGIVALPFLSVGTAVAEQPAVRTVIAERVETPQFDLSDQGVTVPGYEWNDEPGAPLLPVRGLVVELPTHGDWRLTYESIGSVVLAGETDVPAVPVPDLSLNLPENWLGADSLPASVPVKDAPNPSIYGSSRFYPTAPVVAGDEQWMGRRRLLAVRVFPFQYNPITRQLRYHPDVRVQIEIETTGTASAEGIPGESQQGLSNGAATLENALRIHTRERGMYRLTRAELTAAGVPLDVDPNGFAMYYEGQPIAIQLIGTADGTFDSGDLVLFFGVPYDARYQDFNVYWFTWDDQPGPGMATRSVAAPSISPPESIITNTVHVEYDRDYRSTYFRPQDVDHYFDTQLYANVATPTVIRPYTLDLDDPITTTGSVEVRALIHGGTGQTADPDQSVEIHLNGNPIAGNPFQWEGSVDYLAVGTAPAGWLDGTTNAVELEAALTQLPALTYYWISPDWIEVSYPARANAENNRVFIEGVQPGTPEIAVTGFTTDTVAVFDVRNPQSPVLLTGAAVRASGGGYQVEWVETLAGGQYYLAVEDENAFLAPGVVEADASSAWGTPDHSFDYIAIIGADRTYVGTSLLGEEIAAALQPLVAHRESEGLRVAQVDVADLYDEFSFGRRDPQAIRDFLTYAYFNWNSGEEPPQYVLLVGEGHYDFTGVTPTTLPNILPPYQLHVDPWVGEVPTDNRYVSVNGPDDYMPDMHIGRITARNAVDVTAVVNKILTYEDATATPPGPWQQRAVFVADNCADPGGNFHAIVNDVRYNWLPTAYQDQTIYYGDPAVCPDADYATGADMRAAITGTFGEGPFYVQWFGHGSRFRWGSVSMFNIFDVSNLAPNNHLAFSMAHACVTGQFTILWPGYEYWQSLSEQLLLQPDRGSVGDFAPSGGALASSVQTLNRGMIQSLFQLRNERTGKAAVGSLEYYFANSAWWPHVIDTMVLFGDPATRLRLPEGDFTGSTLEVSDAVAPPGATLTYTLTLSNTSIYTVSTPLAVADYAESLGSIANAGGGSDDGSALTWSLADIGPSSSRVLTFSLDVNTALPPGVYDVAVEAEVSSQMAPTVTLSVNTVVPATVDLVADLTADPSWVVPANTVTYTLPLNNAGTLPSTGTAVTLTLPAELEGPSLLTATTGTVSYDPIAHQASWQSDVQVGQAVTLTLQAPVQANLHACGEPTVVADVRDSLGHTFAMSETINLVVPDVNCSDGVTVADIQEVSGRWGSLAGDPRFHPRYDLNADHAITVLDLIAVAQFWQ